MKRATVFTVLVLSVSCSSVTSTTSSACTSGQQAACACGGGAQGFQTCDASGKSFGPCVCDTTSDASVSGPSPDSARDAGQEAQSFGDASGDTEKPNPVACPSVTPSSNSACPSPGQVCEFGSDPILQCNGSYTCVNGTWTVGASTSQQCPTPAATTPCPNSYAGAPNTVCSDVGRKCAYANQGVCECLSRAGQTRWYCDVPKAGCPSPRPHLGSACTGAMTGCSYGYCFVSGGIVLDCRDGSWQPPLTPTLCL